MMYSEFVKMCGNCQTIFMDDYRKIEFVYNYSPIIPDIGGKEKIVRLFQMGGMELIEQLIPACKIAREMEIAEVEFNYLQEKVQKYQTIAKNLDELSEKSDKYWEKASEFLDAQCCTLDKIDNLKNYFEID